MDTASPHLLQQLHPKIRNQALAAWLDACAATPKNVHPQILESVRTFEKSDHYYKLGRTIVNADGKSTKKPLGNIISFAKAGQSFHNYGLAFDLVMMVNGKNDWTPNMKVVEIFKDHGFAWGGDWPKAKQDTPHFEKTMGYKWQGLLALYNKKEFINGTNYLNI